MTDDSLADSISTEREAISADANSKLQTAMLRCWAAHDYRGTIPKAQQAIAEGESEGDHSTVYTALSLMGLASLQVDDLVNATVAIDHIEQMIQGQHRIVIGDETPFLEAARARGVRLDAVARIASRLAPICRDPEFAKRLRELVKSPQ
jgi:hypothetical protein